MTETHFTNIPSNVLYGPIRKIPRVPQRERPHYQPVDYDAVPIPKQKLASWGQAPVVRPSIWNYNQY